MNALTITPVPLHQDAVLRSALERIHQLETELVKLRNNVARPKKSIRIHQSNRVITASPAEILYVRAENNYSRIYLHDGTQYYTSRTLKCWAKELSNDNFLRCHRTFLVNRDTISEINRRMNQLVLRDGTLIPTSRRFQKSCLSSIFQTENKEEKAVQNTQAIVHQIKTRPISSRGQH